MVVVGTCTKMVVPLPGLVSTSAVPPREDGALSNAPQPDAAVEAAGAGLVVEAAAIILDNQRHSRAAALEDDADAGRVRVLVHVVERLLSDPVHRWVSTSDERRASSRPVV